MKKQRTLRIGLSACIFHPDPARKIFNGRSLLYLEESLAHYLQRLGAVVYMLPTVAAQNPGVDLAEACKWLDGLVLAGGVDMCPKSYGETPSKDEWSGDPRRDDYELELLRIFYQQKKPILGICRGLQVINVGFGGTLYQDIATALPQALTHRDAELYEKNHHQIDIIPNTTLARLFPDTPSMQVNSVHHQAIKTLGQGIIANAVSSTDGIIEAIERLPQSPDDPFCYGVQWHPEFQNPNDHDTPDPLIILSRFMDAM